MAQIFISYSKQNVEFARSLRGALQTAGFDVWMDEIRLSTSAQWADTIEASITAASAFVIIMSPPAKESQWVARELLLAQRLRKPIFPILCAGEVWWNLADIQYEDMTAGVPAALSPRMVAALRRSIGGSAPGDTSDTSEAISAHNPPAPPPQSSTDSRRLEAAMPAETRAGADTEVWAKISLPSSEGLRGELPAAVPSGDVIQKADARATGFPIRFPIDARTGRRLPAQAVLRVASGDFEIVAPGERADVEIPPDSDSRTMIFTLQAKPGGRTSGRARIFIDLIMDDKIIAQISVSTVLVAQVTAAVPAWNLAAPGYVIADDSTRGAAKIAAPAAALSEQVEPLPPADIAEFTSVSDYLPQPPASAAPRTDPAARSPSRSGTPVLLRAASAVAALALVLVVALTVTTTQTAAPNPTAMSNSTQFLISATAAAVELSDIGVAPLPNCAGSPGAALVSLLGDFGFDAELLASGIASQVEARALQRFRVVAWGMCSGDTLTLTLELIETQPRQGISDPRSITIQWAADALGQSSSIPVRLARAVTQYARGEGDYAMLAQTFDELAGALSMPEAPEAQAALRTLANNSRFYAGQPEAATPTNP